jgi:glucose/arabinose dehydrogenase
MPRFVALIVALVLALAALPASLLGTSAQDATPGAGPPPFPPPSANVSVFAEGLDNPRGLEFGPDGLLYVAEGGQGGTRSTEGECEQVVPPVGPYTGGDNARISTLDADGQRTSVAEGLPSTQLSPALGSLVAGVADLAFVDDALYYLLAAGGCSHGNPDVPNGIFRVNEDGTTELVADLSAFVMANPTAVQNPGDFEPDESAYGLELFNDELYVAESNHGALDAVDPATGDVHRVLDMTETESHLVPTAMAVGPDGNLYVSNLTTFPITAGAAKVFTVTPEGELGVHAEGVTAVLGLAFDAEGQLYVLETSGPGSGMEAPIVPGTGRVVRLTDGGELEVVATGLVFPTGMVFGPDGTLYVSNFGFGFPPGAGQVVAIDVSAPLPEATPAVAVGMSEMATLTT